MRSDVQSMEKGKNMDKFVVVMMITTMILIFFSRFFLGSVSFDGSDLRSCMISDYWNFGKDFLHGKIFYKDLIDHKGFYLYIVYALLIYVSNNNIAIIVAVEVIVYIAAVLLFYRYMKLVGQYRKTEEFLLLLGFSLSYSYVLRDIVLLNTEGISTIILLLLLCKLKKLNEVTPKLFLIIGVYLGVIASIKITAIILYFPLFVYACAKHVYNNGVIKRLVISIIAGIFGFAMSFLPFIGYLIYHDCVSNFTTIYSYMMGDNGIGILDILIAVIGCFMCALFVTYMKKGETCKSETVFVLSIFVLSAVFSYDARYYIAVYVAIGFVCILHVFHRYKKLLKIAVSLQIAVMLALSTTLLSNEIHEVISMDRSQTTKAVAERYNITNANVLYIWEDFGFGVYSDDTFQAPQQWIPERFYESSVFIDEHIDTTIERLENREFEYVFFLSEEVFQQIVGSLSNVEELSSFDKNKLRLFTAVMNPLLENYDSMDELNGFLYKRKIK